MAITIVLNPLGSTEVWNVSVEVWNVSEEIYSGETIEPELFISGSDFDDITVGFSGYPEISVNRYDDNAVVSLVSATKYDLRIYRANDHRETFYRYVDNVDSTSNFTDEAIWNTYAYEWDSNNVDYDEFSSSKNYKYKASFIAVGTKNGVPFEVESQTSDPIYTIGNKTL